MTNSRMGGRALVVAACSYCVICAGACAGCVEKLRSLRGPTIEFRVRPDGFIGPFQALFWLIRVVLKAMYPFLFDEPP